jgi:zinc transporter ZupT
MTKCKIINATNNALLARQDGIIYGQMVAPVLVMIFNNVLPVFFVMVAAIIVYAIYTNIVEEKMRKKLVDYLENNEIE